MKKFVVTFAIAVMLCGCNNSTERKSEAVRVSIETVTPTVDYDSKVFVGQVEEYSSTLASFTGMGTLESVCVSEGQTVCKGQLIATINAESAKSGLMNAEAQLMQARDAMSRLKTMHDNGSLPEVKWVEIQSQVQQAEAQQRMMKKQLSDCRLVAPVSGVIGSGVMNVGETAMPAMPVARILNIDKVKVRIAVPEREINTIGGSATITVAALDNAEFHSESITKGVQGDVTTRTYDYFVNVSNAGHKLLPGMVANVRFGAGEAEPAITLPVRSIQKSVDKTFVWKVVDGKAQRQNVSVGKTCGDRVVITEGLNKGDKVIIAGFQRVSDNVQVKL